MKFSRTFPTFCFWLTDESYASILIIRLNSRDLRAQTRQFLFAVGVTMLLESTQLNVWIHIYTHIYIYLPALSAMWDNDYDRDALNADKEVEKYIFRLC